MNASGDGKHDYVRDVIEKEERDQRKRRNAER
jgi:hypothetical protein